MTRLIEFLIAAAIVVVLFLVIGLFLPGKRVITHSIETNRPVATAYDTVNGFHHFKEWNPLLSYDNKMKVDYSADKRVKGATMSYDSTKSVVGKGAWTLSEQVPGSKVVYTLANNSVGSNKNMTFLVEPVVAKNKNITVNTKNIKITQTYTVDYGWNVFGRFAGLYVNRNVGDEMKSGLKRLNTYLISVPKFDYALHTADFNIVNLPAQNALIVPTEAKRSENGVQIAMTNQMGWVKKVMDANGLVNAGPMRIVTTDFSSGSYSFDIVVPVRKASSAAPAEGAEPAGDTEKLSIKVEGPVKADMVPAVKAAATEFTGSAGQLAFVRDMLRAWTMTNGYEPVDRAFEQYMVPVAQQNEPESKFKVYWPIK
jgi:Polyketide cyclase / dehydrase and lipid transport